MWLLALLACGRDGSSARPDSARTQASGGAGQRPSAELKTILFLGTSLTAGLGLDPEDAFPTQIQRKIDSAGMPFEVVNAGVSGETSAG
ncbi:MAG: arylesterase, partial [Candidatus Binatia bacterium]